MLVLTLLDDICWRGHVNTGSGGPAKVLCLIFIGIFHEEIYEAKFLEKRIYTSDKQTWLLLVKKWSIWAHWVVCGEFFCVNKFRFHSVFRPPLEAPLSTDTASLSKIALYRIFSCQQRHRTADPLRVIFLMMTMMMRMMVMMMMMMASPGR